MDPKLLLLISGGPQFPNLLSVASPSPSRLRSNLAAAFPAKSPLAFPSVAKSSSIRRELRIVSSSAAAAAVAVKWRKEHPFDTVIQRDKKLKLVLKIRNILVRHPGMTMSLKALGRHRRSLGLTGNRRLIAVLRRFPAVFRIAEEGCYSLGFRLTPEAEAIYLEELRIGADEEEEAAAKLQKMLMMSVQKRISLEKLSHLRSDLGLPVGFVDTVCRRHPRCFNVVDGAGGPELELAGWDPELAVAAAAAGEEVERDFIIDRPARFRRAVELPRGMKLSKGEAARVSRFRDLPYISPYSELVAGGNGGWEREKRACGVVHEVLSLTVEKRTLVDHLTHFREEFGFSQQLRQMLIRHPDMFYVSLKGDRDSVFLRDAYRGSHLVDKSRRLILKEKLRALVAVPRLRGRGTAAADDEEDGSEEEEEDDGLEFVGDSEFTEEEEDVKKGEEEEKDPAPVFPDGRPREQW